MACLTPRARLLILSRGEISRRVPVASALPIVAPHGVRDARGRSRPSPGWRFAVAACMVCMSTRLAGAESTDLERLTAIREHLCYVETFGDADGFDDLDEGDGDKPLSDTVLPDVNAAAATNHPGMLTGRSVAGRASEPRDTFTLPVAEAIPLSTGTLSWWVQFNYRILDGGTLLTLRDGGPLYVRFFGTSAADKNHRNRGFYWNVQSGAGFVWFPNLIAPDVWHHCAFTWNGDRSAFFFDGYQRGASGTSRPFSDLLNDKTHKANAFKLWGEHALFDEIRVYNRALSDREIRTYVEAVNAGGARREQALALPKQLASRDTFGSYAAYRLSDHAVLAFVDLSTIAAAGDRQLSVALIDGGGKTIASATALPAQTDGVVPVQMPLHAPLPEGTYRVRANWAGRQTTASFERTRFEWEDNDFGYTDKVVNPWLPVEVSGQAASCWGRTYTFGPLGLPAAIRSTQPEPSRGVAAKELLAEPVRLLVEGKDGPLALNGTELQVRRRNETAADVTAAAEAPGLSVRLEGTLEFDGLYKFTIRLTPSAPMSVTSIRLEAVLPDELALLFNASAERMRRNKAFLNLEGRPDGELWNSVVGTTIRPEPILEKGNRAIVGNLWPHLWLGDDDRGLAVMCDSDRGWLLDFDKPCMDLVRRGGRTVLRIHLANGPSEWKEPLSATLSLQATPVRPRPKGGRWKDVGWYGWSAFDQPVIWDKCFDTYVAENNPIYYVTDEARKEKRWWRYFCLQSHRISSSDSHSAMVTPNTLEWEAGLHTPSHRDFLLWIYRQWRDVAGLDGFYMDNTYAPVAGNVASGLAWNDAAGRTHPVFNTFGSRELLKRARTLFLEAGPAPVMQAHMTDAPVVGYLGLFDLWLDGENGGYDNPTPEQAKDETENPKNHFRDFVDRWYSPTGMANLRITLGRQWGVIPKWLYNWGPDATFAVLGQFDLNVPAPGVARRTSLYDFGLANEDVVFMPYWDTRRPVTIGDGTPHVLPAVWVRPGRARILLSNMGETDVTTSIGMDLETLGLPDNTAVVDGLDGSSLPVVNGAVRDIAVGRHNFRLLLAAAAGEFPPADPNWGKTLNPAKPLGFFCDDFAALHAAPSPQSPIREAAGPSLDVEDVLGGIHADSDPDAEDDDLQQIREQDTIEDAVAAFHKNSMTEAHQKSACWRTAFSRNIETGFKWPISPIDLKQGWLRIRTDTYHYAFVYRPFYQDMCSIQVKIGESTGDYGPGYGPSLFVYWDDRRWVRMRAGMEKLGSRGKAWSKAIVAEGAGRKSFGLAGPEAGATNWLKIRLAPETIEFFASTDGKAWESVHRVSREDCGYHGPPRYVLLGHGAPGRNGLFMNDEYNEHYNCYSFFDDFLVGE